jgi:hypothetical protein
MKKCISMALLFAGVLAWLPASAGSALDTGNHVIHYNVLSTDLLDPQVAKEYGIKRSKNRGMLNVTVVRKDSTTGTAVPATVSASATNLNGQLRNINVRKVEEQQAIYYIGEFAISDGETLDFTITVKPEGGDERVIEFRQAFFTD